MARRMSLTEAMRRRPLLAQLLLLLLFLLLWEIAARFFVDKLFLSPPSRVYGEIGRVVYDEGSERGATRDALRAGGSLCDRGCRSASTIGLMIGLSGFARRSFMPIVSAGLWNTANHHTTSLHSLLWHRPALQDRIRRHARDFSHHVDDCCRRAEPQARAADQRALDGGGAIGTSCVTWFCLT